MNDKWEGHEETSCIQIPFCRVWLRPALADKLHSIFEHVFEQLQLVSKREGIAIIFPVQSCQKGKNGIHAQENVCSLGLLRRPGFYGRFIGCLTRDYLFLTSPGRLLAFAFALPFSFRCLPPIISWRGLELLIAYTQCMWIQTRYEQMQLDLNSEALPLGLAVLFSFFHSLFSRRFCAPGCKVKNPFK